MDKELTLHKAIQLAQQKRYIEAAKITRALLEVYPNEDRAWYLLAVVSPHPYQKRMYLRRALEINPHNEVAARKFKALERSSENVKREEIYISSPTPAPEKPSPQPSQQTAYHPVDTERIRSDKPQLNRQTTLQQQQTLGPTTRPQRLRNSQVGVPPIRGQSTPNVHQLHPTPVPNKAQAKPKKKMRFGWYLLSGLFGIFLAVAVFLIFASPYLNSYMIAFGAAPSSNDSVGSMIAQTLSVEPTLTATEIPTSTLTPTNTATMTPTATLTPTVTLTPTNTATLIPPTITPIPPLPDNAYVNGIYGTDQIWSLSCEASAAVDWANYFGVKIYESDFHNTLPVSDNPEIGFVGSVHGQWGQIPPYPYGVHAEPVARLLRAYGLPARAVKNFTLEELKREIAEGRPVIIWMIGASWTNVGAREYTAEDGSVVKVAPYEHVALLVGYGKDYVTIMDGTSVYYKSFDTFMKSFRVLDRMAVIYKDD